MPFEKSAGAIIFRRNKEIKYLLLHYPPIGSTSPEEGHWGFPKGNIEEGEKIEETVRREVAEETGLTAIQLLPGFKEGFKYCYKLEGENIFKIVTFLLAETKTRGVEVSSEHLGYEWLPYEQALERLTFQNAKDILKKANDFVESSRTLF